MKELSSRQRAIYNFIRTYIDEFARPPTIREIQASCNISSTSVVDYNLNILERAELIRRSAEISRSIQLVNRLGTRSTVVTLPVIGVIAAGQPIPDVSAETWQSTGSGETVDVPAEMAAKADNLFALRVRGLSMIDALIDDGDIVILRAQSSAENGEMVAALLKTQNETTLKRIYWEGERVRLQPANSQMNPIYSPVDNVAVQGKVIGVIRRVA